LAGGKTTTPVTAFAHVKSNYSALQPTLALEFNGQPEPHITFGDELEVTADELVQQLQQTVVPEAPERGRAAEFLQRELRLGPMRVRELIARARKEGIAVRTLVRAKEHLSLPSRKIGAVWVWCPPEEAGPRPLFEPSS